MNDLVSPPRNSLNSENSAAPGLESMQAEAAPGGGFTLPWARPSPAPRAETASEAEQDRARQGDGNGSNRWRARSPHRGPRRLLPKEPETQRDQTIAKNKKTLILGAGGGPAPR